MCKYGYKSGERGGVKNNLHCLYTNIRSIMSSDKREELRITLQQQKAVATFQG